MIRRKRKDRRQPATEPPAWITSRQVSKCPIGSVLISHYWPSGACKCRWPETAADPEADAPVCAVCGGQGKPLGRLGHRDYFRCRDCGLDLGTEAKP